MSGKSSLPSFGMAPMRRKSRNNLSTHTLVKPLKHQFRLRRTSLSVPLCVGVFCLVLIVFFPSITVNRLVSFLKGSPDLTIKPIGKTSIGTPILPLPTPHGFAAPVMAMVLKNVQQYIRGGSMLSEEELVASVDREHLHGAIIGHFPKTKQPQWLPEPFDFKSQTVEMKHKAHANASFNKVMSNSLPLDRPVPEVRPVQCKTEWYYNTSSPNESGPTSFLKSSRFSFSNQKSNDKNRLPTASVVIIFHNEFLSTLLRSVHSVLNRTPPHLLHEVILVDDGSNKKAPWLLEGGKLERHLQLLPKTYIARLLERKGLMFARNTGAALSSGEVVIFLDSHIETMDGWLEPLLGRIAEGMRSGVNHVVVPAIDNIDADSFNISKGGIDILGHTWGLGQIGIPNNFDPNSPDPMQSPIMAGGLLAVSREYFDRLGFYDPEMKYWGGEEMEISFRIWLCGGTLECLPCSRVGHVFRSSKFWTGQVYEVPGNAVSLNRVRASFWMDEYADLAKMSATPLKDNETAGSMEFYHDVKKRMQCKPFRWYLEHVNTGLWESANRLFGEGHRAGETSILDLFPGRGYMRNRESETCMDHLHHKVSGAPFGVYPCHFSHGSQAMVYTNTGYLLSAEKLLEGCLTREKSGTLSQRQCSDDLLSSQQWEMVKKSKRIVLLKWGNQCLTVVDVPEPDDKSPSSLRMKRCGDEHSTRQTWEWEKPLGDLPDIRRDGAEME